MDSLAPHKQALIDFHCLTRAAPDVFSLCWGSTTGLTPLLCQWGPFRISVVQKNHETKKTKKSAYWADGMSRFALSVLANVWMVVGELILDILARGNQDDFPVSFLEQFSEP